LAEAQIMSYASHSPLAFGATCQLDNANTLLVCVVTHVRNLPAHPNVVTFFGLAEGPSELFIVTEFMPDGSLDKHLIQNR
jgi:serine/threonine protein kinase